MRKIRLDDSCLNLLTNVPVDFTHKSSYIHTYILKNHIPKIIMHLLTGDWGGAYAPGAHLVWLRHCCATIDCIFRPPDVVAGGLRFYRDSSSSFFVSYPPSSLNRTQPNRPRVRKWVSFENSCPKSAVSAPFEIGAQNRLFSAAEQLNGNFNGQYLRNETW